MEVFALTIKTISKMSAFEVFSKSLSLGFGLGIPCVIAILAWRIPEILEFLSK